MAFKIGIDVGGTFTDFLAMGRRGQTSVRSIPPRPPAIVFEATQA